MLDRRAIALVAVGAGLVVGALSSIGRAHLDGTLDAVANSVSTWLVVPFAVGTLAATRRTAAAVGLAACAAQIVGYYAVDHAQGVATPASLIAFWTVCAVLGGPVFAVAGQLWRSTAAPLRGLGMALLAGIFIAEGLYAYLHQLHQYRTAALWVAFGVALAVLAGRGRVEQVRWLGLTVPLGVAGEVGLTAVLHRFF